MGAPSAGVSPLGLARLEVRTVVPGVRAGNVSGRIACVCGLTTVGGSEGFDALGGATSGL